MIYTNNLNKKHMKKILITACCLALTIIQSCSKPNAETEKPPINTKYEATVPELGLKLNFSFERKDPDNNFQIALSDNFSIQQMSCKHLIETNTTYFFVNCINNTNGSNHFINGIVNAKDEVSITTLKVTPDN